MPTYDYRCDECGHAFEEFQAITAKPLKKCPSCGRRTLQRLIGSGGGIIFRGSGFYQTDYRSDSYRRAAAADTSTTSDSSSDKSSKSDKKPAKPAKEKAAKKSTTAA